MTAPRTLVVAPSWVGDTVMALPVLDALEAAGRRLFVLARPGLHPLLAAHRPAADLLARAGGDRAVAAAIRDAAPDEALLLPNSFHAAWLALRGGVPKRWGYRGDFRRPLLAPSVPRPPGTAAGLRSGLASRLRRRLAGHLRVPPVERGELRHQSADYAELLAAMNVPPPTSWTPRLELSPGALADGDHLLGRCGLAGRSPVIGLFAGAEFGPSKRWPAARFAAAARALRRARPEIAMAWIAGPKEVDLAVDLHEETGAIHPVVGPDLDLARLAHLLARLDLLVTNDSGPMHLAAAVGTPVVAIFGPTDPRRTAPAGEGHRVLSTWRWCSPCFRRRCPLVHHRCMRGIGVGDVVAGVLGILEGSDGERDGDGSRS